MSGFLYLSQTNSVFFMDNFILIFCCLSAGIVMSALQILPKDSHKSLNAWLLYIALPALALRFVPEIEWNMNLILPGLSPLIVWGGAWVVIGLYARKMKLDKGTRTALIVASGLGNTSFLGFPMISAFYGEDQIYNAIVFDQVTFLLFSTVAVIVILRAAGGHDKQPGFAYIVKKVLRFPPFVACLLALLLSPWLDFSPMNPFLDKLVATLSPLALFSIGLQLKITDWKKELPHLSVGLFYKLMLAPALVFLFTLLLQGSGNLARITLFEASMSSHITAGLLASQYNMNPRLCTLMIGFGLIANILSAPFWWWVGEVFL